MPEDLSQPNHNDMNLLELPVLFYRACLILYASGSVELIHLWPAWVLCCCERCTARFT